MTDELRATLFDGAPLDDAAWIGPVVVIEDQLEVVPFQCISQRFLMYFTTLTREWDGDQDLAGEMAAEWTNDFVPEPEHRLVKFMRAEVDDVDRMYDPDAWPLPNPRMVFQVGQLLVDVVLAHAEAFPDVVQYLFIPGNARLAKLYQRVARSCCPVEFRPILALEGNDGGACGYQRTGPAG